MPFCLLRCAVSLVVLLFVAAMPVTAAMAQTSGQTEKAAPEKATPAQAASERGAPQSEKARDLNWPSAWKSEVAPSGAPVPKKPEREPVRPKPAGVAQAQSIGNGAPGKSETKAESENAKVPEPNAASTEAANPAASDAAPAAAAPGEAKPAEAAPNGGPAPAASKPPELPKTLELSNTVSKQIETTKGLADRLSLLEKTVERVKDRDDELTQQLPVTDKIIAEALAAAAQLKPALADIHSQIDKLGPAPENGKTESDEIAVERKRLNAVANEIDGAIKTAELTEIRTRQLSATIQTLRLENFRKSLFKRSPSLLSPKLWSEALQEVPRAFQQLNRILANWYGRLKANFANVLGVFGTAFVVGLVLQLLSRRARRLLREQSPDALPTYFRRVVVASLEAPLRMIPKIAAAAVLFVGFDTLNLLYLQIGGLAVAAYKAVAILAGGTAFTTAYLQPARPAWRVIDLGDQASWKLRRIIRWAVILFAIDVLARSAIRELYLPLSANIVWTSVVSLLFATLFYRAVHVTVTLPDGTGPRFSFFAQHAHKVPLIAAISIIIGALLTGFVALAHFVATRLLVVGSAIFLLAIFYLSNRAIAVEPDQNKFVTGSGSEIIPIEIRRRLARGLSVVLDIVLFLIATPLLLLSVGFAPAEITTLSNRALFGFQVGGVEISLAKIGIAIGLAAAILFLSRLLQRWLGETILHPSRTEQGLGNSIRTGVGYIGFIVAVLAGLSYAGLDITNLAIVAGALSVGIGFGLQSIVNNFVSGLILLVERPIKVGDWIKVADTQGYVRRISVRSTEIETFERASVIIPNSELISGTVTNMTLRNALGRITIPVGVSYDSDPELVHKLLLEAADECELVARHPAPFVVFEDFGNSSLDFTLRIYVPDVNSSLGTQTDVRKRILKKFREHNIEIPFPQRDLNVRNIKNLPQQLASVTAHQVKGPLDDDDIEDSGALEGDD